MIQNYISESSALDEMAIQKQDELIRRQNESLEKYETLAERLLGGESDDDTPASEDV